MFKRRGYIFTTKRHSKRGIMSTVLGTLSIITLSMDVYLSYLNQGVVSARHGAAALLAIIFMVIGLFLGLWSTTEQERYRLFTVLGITANSLALGILSLILYAGAYVE